MNDAVTTGSATVTDTEDPLATALRKVPLFSSLDSAGCRQLAEHCRRRQIDRPEVVLFHEGDEPGSLYVVLSGTVQVRSVTSAGRAVYLAQRGPGEVLGELALIDGEPRMADVVTASPCDLLVLRREAFLRCVRQNPDIAIAVMTALAQRLREAARQQADREEQDVPGRLARLLLDWMERHGEPLPSGEVRLSVKRTHQQMAEQIGAARESVSRALADLRDLRIVRTEGRSLILRPDRLRTQAERH